jgi:hypothetical protein
MNCCGGTRIIDVGVVGRMCCCYLCFLEFGFGLCMVVCKFEGDRIAAGKWNFGLC